MWHSMLSHCFSSQQPMWETHFNSRLWIQHPAYVPEKPSEDSPNAWAPVTTWETAEEFLGPGLGLAQTCLWLPFQK